MDGIATFAAGCFWGVEKAFRALDGVLDVRVGYTGGSTEQPTYGDVRSGKTGHAEAVRVIFDPDRISYGDLLRAFWNMHDPTQVNRQGNDIGTPYRSVIFYHSDEQRRTAEYSKDAEEGSGKYTKPIETLIIPAGPFYEAEDEHQRYFEKRPCDQEPSMRS